MMNPNSEHSSNSKKERSHPILWLHGRTNLFFTQAIRWRAEKFPQPFVEQFDNKCNQKMKRLEFNEGFKQLARGNLNLFA